MTKQAVIFKFEVGLLKISHNVLSIFTHDRFRLLGLLAGYLNFERS